MGLIGSNTQTAPQPGAPSAPAPQGAPGAPAAAGGQQIVQRIITAALMLLNTDQVEQHVIALIKGAQDPAQGIAQAFVFILRAVHDKSKGMPMQALGESGKPILLEILKIAVSAKIVQPTQQFIQQVMQAVQAALSGGGAQQPPQQSAQNAAPPGTPLTANNAPAPTGA